MVATLHAQVHGAGPTGVIAALALVHAGWRVNLIDPLHLDQLTQRNRAYAFTYSSRQLLFKIGLWDELKDQFIPFNTLRLSDEAIATEVELKGSDLNSKNTDLGWIARHSSLMQLLLRRVENNPNINLILGSDPHHCNIRRNQSVDLVVAADGPDSPTRSALAIGKWRWFYQQACLTAQVEMRGCPTDWAWERLRPEGPFAILPLGAEQFQMVWSAPQSRCRQLQILSGEAFLNNLARALPEQLQPDALLDTPKSFPVSLHLAHRLHRGNTLLLGESAHRCHPVGGQGLNLCWRDVDVLLSLARRAQQGQLDPSRIGAAYGWRRWPDVIATLLLTDLLVRLFSNRHKLLLLPRRLALLLLARFAPIRQLVLGTMTYGPCRLLARRPL